MRAANAFRLSACVIDHLFHPPPREVSTSGRPASLVVLTLTASCSSIVDHRHATWRPYAGVNIYQGDQWPAEWKAGLQGNIHPKRDQLGPIDPQGIHLRRFQGQ